MEQYELEMESGLKLSRQGAQSIVEEVGAVVGQNINMMDRRGYRKCCFNVILNYLILLE